MKNKRLLCIIAALILLVGFFYVRNSSEAGKEFTDSLISAVAGETESGSDYSAEHAEEQYAAEEESSSEPEAYEAVEEGPAEQEGPDKAEAEAAEDEKTLDEDGVYDSKEDVALYLHLYHHLPSNYITKNEAKDRGWSGSGSDKLDKYCPGMCIGGDYFGNYENILPKGKYRECDIDTLGEKSRGAKRIVFSSDWYIYYTDDHYESFELLYEP